MKVRRTVALAAMTLLAAGCAQGLQVQKADREALLSRSKHVVLLTQSKWDGRLRQALVDEGFRVDGAPGTATTGVAMTLGKQVDFCVVNENIKLDIVTLTVTDLETRKTLLTVAKGGITGPCAWHTGSVFEDLAVALKDVWEGRDPDR
ncbi:MAG: hypothetical protein HYR51_09155 [Candidatus Rokubacteria bacterium]|nr:hypothetical protein [Candidatus Rokubacteria bacterium]